MPKLHGLFYDKKLLVFRVGIIDIVKLYEENYPINNNDKVITELSFRQKVEYHLRTSTVRLLYCLDVYQRRLKLLEKKLNKKSIDITCNNTQLELGIVSDSILHYLNIFIDDVGRMLCYVVLNDNSEYSGFSRLIKEGIEHPSDEISTLFRLIDEDKKSWWNRCFKYGTGLRQKVVHYLDIIGFQGQKKEKEKAHVAKSYLSSLSRERETVDFEKGIIEILFNLCEWLDSAYLSAAIFIKNKMNLNSIPSDGNIPCILLPIEHTRRTRIIPDNYLYLPVCEGSHPR